VSLFCNIFHQCFSLLPDKKKYGLEKKYSNSKFLVQPAFHQVQLKKNEKKKTKKREKQKHKIPIEIVIQSKKANIKKKKKKLIKMLATSKIHLKVNNEKFMSCILQIIELTAIQTGTHFLSSSKLHMHHYKL
jgi:hypothetical protein